MRLYVALKGADDDGRTVVVGDPTRNDGCGAEWGNDLRIRC